MPLYEYLCPAHGRFDRFSSYQGQDPILSCPQCGALSPKVISVVRTHIKNKPRLRYGTGEPTRVVKQVDDKPGFIIMSEGLLEKEEVDYIEGAQRDKLQTYERKTQKRKVSIASERKHYDVEVKEIG